MDKYQTRHSLKPKKTNVKIRGVDDYPCMLVRAGKNSGGTTKKGSTPGAKIRRKGDAESSAGRELLFFYSPRGMEKNVENRIGHEDDEVDWCM